MTASDRALRVVSLADVEMRSIEWLDRPLLQGAAFTLVAGPKGVGKGTWLAATTAAMTRGEYGGVPRNVLFLSTEDSASIDLKPRLIAAGADVARVELVAEPIVFPHDLGRLYDLAVETRVGMIVIDPIGNHLAGADTDREGAVRHAVGGLNDLADRLGCVILGVRHYSKNRSAGAAGSVLGSTAWVDLPRAVLGFAPDDEDDSRFHVQVVAGNRSGRGAGKTYRIELADVGLKEPVTRAVCVGTSRKDVDELLAAPKRSSKSQSARDLLLEVLEAEGVQGADALDARIAKETGLAPKTIRNLRSELKAEGLLKVHPEKDEHGAIVRWTVVRSSELGAPERRAA